MQTGYLVFVYGTLKQGHGNHHLLEESTFLGKAVTQEKFEMLEDGIPVVLRASEGSKARRVSGEVYIVDDNTLERLDHLESNGSLYDREPVSVVLEDGSVIEAMMYIGMNPGRWRRSGYKPSTVDAFGNWRFKRKPRFVNDDADDAA